MMTTLRYIAHISFTKNTSIHECVTLASAYHVPKKPANLWCAGDPATSKTLTVQNMQFPVWQIIVGSRSTVDTNFGLQHKSCASRALNGCANCACDGPPVWFGMCKCEWSIVRLCKCACEREREFGHFEVNARAIGKSERYLSACILSAQLKLKVIIHLLPRLHTCSLARGSEYVIFIFTKRKVATNLDLFTVKLHWHAQRRACENSCLRHAARNEFTVREAQTHMCVGVCAP